MHCDQIYDFAFDFYAILSIDWNLFQHQFDIMIDSVPDDLILGGFYEVCKPFYNEFVSAEGYHIDYVDIFLCADLHNL